MFIFWSVLSGLVIGALVWAWWSDEQPQRRWNWWRRREYGRRRENVRVILTDAKRQIDAVAGRRW